MRLVILTSIAMIAFAANSVLARLALVAGETEALGYTGVRIASGAVVLYAIVRLRRGEEAGQDGAFSPLGGSWSAAAALFGYAIAFSLAYLMLGAGTGALILFASVQFGMLAFAFWRGDRPGALEWLGVLTGLAALGYLVSPGLVAPHPLGAALMIAAGLCWAAYTLLGRGSRAPLVDTAGNFVRCLPLAMAFVVAGFFAQAPTPSGLAYALASGVLASGLGYAIWYAALPALARTQAAFVQLTVPAIAAAGGVAFLSEPVTARLVIASVGILGGVALALWASGRRQQGR